MKQRPRRGRPLAFEQLSHRRMLASLAGFVYFDVDGDGTRDSGETGIPGVIVTLTGTDADDVTVNVRAMTDDTGAYKFSNLEAGDYVITETHPAGWDDGTDKAGAQGGTAGSDAITVNDLGAAVTGTEYNFGEDGVLQALVTKKLFLNTSSASAFRTLNAEVAAKAGNATLASEIRNKSVPSDVSPGDNDGGETGNLPPNDIGISAATVDEDATNGTVVGQLRASDPENNLPLTFTLTNSANGTFSINSSNQLVVANAANLNASTTPSLSITVRVADSLGATREESFTITVTAGNSAPTNIQLSNSSIAESSAVGATVGSFSATDPEGNTPLTFTLTNSAGGTFAINSLNQLVVADAASLNAGPTPSLTITVRVADSLGATRDQSFTITVNAVNEAPTNIQLSNSSIADASAVGATVGTFSASDPDAGDTHTYTLVIDGGGLFSISGNELRVAAQLNGETTPSVPIRVRATDAAGLTFEKDFLINVTVPGQGPNEAPSFTLQAASDSSNEDAGQSTVPNFATDISPGAGENESNQTVSFVVTPSGTSTLTFLTEPSVDANGTLTYTAAANSFGSATFKIVAKDNGGTAGGGVDTSAEQTFVINVLPVNDAPSFAVQVNSTTAQDSGPVSVSDFVTNISPGPSNESDQNVAIEVTNVSNPSLFSEAPTIGPDGKLRYTPAPGASGVATITLRAVDEGGTDNGGVNSSGTQQFTILITPADEP